MEKSYLLDMTETLHPLLQKHIRSVNISEWMGRVHEVPLLYTEKLWTVGADGIGRCSFLQEYDSL